MRTSEKVLMPIMFAVIAVICIGLACQNYQLKKELEIMTADNNFFNGRQMLTVMELQIALRDRGYYKGKIDGKCGKATRKAWDKAICDQFAAAAFRPAYYQE